MPTAKNRAPKDKGHPLAPLARLFGVSLSNWSISMRRTVRNPDGSVNCL